MILLLQHLSLTLKLFDDKLSTVYCRFDFLGLFQLTVLHESLSEFVPEVIVTTGVLLA